MTIGFDKHEKDFEAVHKVSEHLYTYLTHFLFNGTIPLNNRSIVVHLPASRGQGTGGELAIINPAEMTPKVLSGLQHLQQSSGAKVRYLLSPGDWHYMFIGAYLKAFPGSTAYVPPGRIPSKKPDYPYQLLDITKPNPLPQLLPHLEVYSFHGMLDFEDPAKTRPRYEFAFYHRESKTFTAADIFMYVGVGELSPALKAAGLRFGALEFHFMKDKVIRDSSVLAQSLEHVLQWRPEYYICQHGGLGNMLVGKAYEQVERLHMWARALDIKPH